MACYAEVEMESPGSFSRYVSKATTELPTEGDRHCFAAGLAAYPDIFDFYVGSRRLLHRSKRGRATAAFRQELCDDDDWYRSEVYNEFRRPLRSDHNAVAVVEIEAGNWLVLAVNQLGDDARPTERTKSQMALLLSIGGSLISRELATERQRCRDGLSKQLRATLDQLLAGRSEKEIAVLLGLRRPTVHQYIGQLYRHFNVASRAQLMAYFIRRRPEPK